MKNKIVKNSLLIFFLLALMAIPLFALALDAPDNPVPGPGDPVTPRKLADWIDAVAKFFLAVGVVIAVIFIVWGAVRYMFAQGGDTGPAKTTIWNGIIGAAIILGIGLILETVKWLIDNGINF